MTGCDANSLSTEKSITPAIRRGEYISRLHDEKVEIPAVEKREIRPYPWKRRTVGHFPKITKEHFRCKGNYSNRDKVIEEGGESVMIQDCGGTEQHSLPLREGKEFVYPILLNLLNYLQSRVEKPIIITSGHRCPTHNRYNDPRPKSQYSKHMIGAEVTFYVEELENSAESLVLLIQEYFQGHAEYQGLREYVEFKRWEKPVDVSTQPWYNKEVFIKVYRPNEGRDFDNRHSYPYISIQVRYDRALNEGVSYSWNKAFENYWRW